MRALKGPRRDPEPVLGKGRRPSSVDHLPSHPTDHGRASARRRGAIERMGKKPQVCRTYWYSPVFGIRSRPTEPRPSGCARKGSADLMLTLCGGCAFLKWRSYGAERFLIVRALAGENDSFVVCLGIITQEAARWPKKALPP